MLKALECRYEDDVKLTSGGSNQLPVCTLADSEFDVASSSTSCADSGRGLSCEVHDDPTRTFLSSAAPAVCRAAAAAAEPSAPLGRNPMPPPLERFGGGTETERGMATFGRGGRDVVGRMPEATACQGSTLPTLADGLLAHSAALDACRQPPPLRSTVNFVGTAGTYAFH